MDTEKRYTQSALLSQDWGGGGAPAHSYRAAPAHSYRAAPWLFRLSNKYRSKKTHLWKTIFPASLLLSGVSHFEDKVLLSNERLTCSHKKMHDFILSDPLGNTNLILSAL